MSRWEDDDGREGAEVRRPLVYFHRRRSAAHPAVIAQKMKAGMQHNMARALLITLQSCLNIAQAEGIIVQNPVRHYGKWLLRGAPQRTKVEHIFTEPELRTLRVQAERLDPRAHMMAMPLARTGMRIGEATALQVHALDFECREIWVRRTWGSRVKAATGGQFNSPKGGKERRVDLALVRQSR